MGDGVVDRGGGGGDLCEKGGRGRGAICVVWATWWGRGRKNGKKFDPRQIKDGKLEQLELQF
jgi:hypothetical protein